MENPVSFEKMLRQVRSTFLYKRDTCYSLNFLQKKRDCVRTFSNLAVGKWLGPCGLIWLLCFNWRAVSCATPLNLPLGSTYSMCTLRGYGGAPGRRGVRGYVPGCLGCLTPTLYCDASQPATSPVCLSVSHPQLETSCSWHLLYLTFCESGRLGFNS